MRVGVGGFSRNIAYPSQTEDEWLNSKTKKQVIKNKDFLDNDEIIKSLRLGTSEIPKTTQKTDPWQTTVNSINSSEIEKNPWNTRTIEGDPGKFSRRLETPSLSNSMSPVMPYQLDPRNNNSPYSIPNLIQNFLQKPKTSAPNIPMQSLGMPGPQHIQGIAQNITGAIPDVAKDMFSRMKQAVTEGPYSSPTGEYDPKIGMLGPETLMGGFGRAVGVGAQGGRFVKPTMAGKVGGKETFFSPRVKESMDRIAERLGDVSDKIKIKAFRERFPEYPGTDETIRRNFYRNQKDVELGAFGGKGRLNTESTGESMGWLQSQKPVDKEWVEEWAKNARIDIKNIKKVGSNKNPTYYLKLEDPQNPGNIATVRVPTDEMRHHGYPQSPSKAGNFFDTGLFHQYPPKVGTPITNITEDDLKALFEGKSLSKSPIENLRPASEHVLINQSGQPYASQEALNEALALKFSKSPPFGNFKLVSEDFAPRIPEVIPPTSPKPYKDPRQLKLLSSGITPANILEYLQRNQPNGS